MQKEEISDRFDKFVEYIGITYYKLAKEIFTSEAVLSNIKSGKSKPSVDLLEKLLKKYSVLNTNWLITGNGKMLIGDTDTKTPPAKAEGVKKVESKKDVISYIDEIESKQKEIQANLKTIRTLLQQGSGEDPAESSADDPGSLAERYRAEAKSGKIGVRNTPVKKKSASVKR